MEKQNQENNAYVNFIQDLNEILGDFNINKLNCS